MPTGNRVDLALINGKIITMGPDSATVQAVAIKGDRIVGTGSNAGIKRILSRGVKIIDLKGKTATPGLIESHCHPNTAGTTMLFEAELKDARSMDEISDILITQGKKIESGAWIKGRGYDDKRLKENRHPNRRDLDRVSTTNPVYITRADGHIAVINSLALQKAGITKDTPDPVGGRYDRDEFGLPNGILRESGLATMRKYIPPYTISERKEGIIAAQQQLASWGITSYGDAGVDRDAFIAYQDLLKEGKLQQRVAMMMNCLTPIGDSLLDFLVEGGFKAGFGDEHLRIEGAKLFCDGSMSGWTAALYEPYANMPSERGIIVYSVEGLHNAIIKAHQAGLRPIIHAIGDRAIDVTLDGIEKALQKYPTSGHRIRIEHLNLPTGPAIDRMKRLGVMPGSSIGFLYELGPAHVIGLGQRRMQYYMPHKTYLEKGMVAAGNSDWMVTSANIAQQLYGLVTRKAYDGQIIGGHQAIAITEALKLYTINAAYASFEEGLKGSIEIGKLADFTILDRDILTVPSDDLINIKVEMTIIGGEVVYKKGS